MSTVHQGRLPYWVTWRDDEHYRPNRAPAEARTPEPAEVTRVRDMVVARFGAGSELLPMLGLEGES